MDKRKNYQICHSEPLKEVKNPFKDCLLMNILGIPRSFPATKKLSMCHREEQAFATWRSPRIQVHNPTWKES